MTILELIFIILLITLFTRILINKTQFQLTIAGLLLLTLLLHLVLDGYRWQLVPAYLVFLLSGSTYINGNFNKWLRGILAILGMLLIIVSGFLSWLAPLFEFPEPTGKYTVGDRTFYWTDQNRPSPNPNAEARRLAVSLWYPSLQEIDNPKPHYDDGYAQAWALSKGLPDFLFSHLSNVKTNTEGELSFAKGEHFPVIILSHGMLWNAEMYTGIIEELVSHGYVVAGIDYTYETPLTIFEGERIYWDQSMVDKKNRFNFDSLQKLMSQYQEVQNESIQLELLKSMNDIVPYKESFDRWSADISFVIDRLTEENTNSSSLIFKKLNMNKLGLLGHSWGGSASVQNASYDGRAKAVANMDGAQWGIAIDTTLHIPLLALFADRDYDTYFTPNLVQYSQLSQNDSYAIAIKGAGHSSYGDLP